MWPAVVVVAAHLQPDVQDGVHTQHVSCVEANSLRTTDLLQTLLHTLLHWTHTHTLKQFIIKLSSKFFSEKHPIFYFLTM